MEGNGNPRYNIILWDVDGTLLNFLESESYAFSETFRQYGFEVDSKITQLYSAINDSYWKRLEKGEVDKTQVLRGRFISLFEALSEPSYASYGFEQNWLKSVDVDEFRDLYQKYLGSVYYYQDDSLNLCKRLKSAGIKQYIITNGVTSSQKNKLTLAGFYDVVEDVYISEEVGYHKPDSRFFDVVLNRMFPDSSSDELEKQKKNILIVGDSQTSDMQGARNIGVDCCFYTNGKPFNTPAAGQEVNYQIKNLNEVEKILWQNQKNRD